MSDCADAAAGRHRATAAVSLRSFSFIFVPFVVGDRSARLVMRNPCHGGTAVAVQAILESARALECRAAGSARSLRAPLQKAYPYCAATVVGERQKNDRQIMRLHQSRRMLLPHGDVNRGMECGSAKKT